MTSFPTRVAQASFKSDFSKMRRASAFRRGVVVFAVTLGAYLHSGTATASHVAITAMFVGQLDRGGSPRQEWHWMAGATVLMASVSVVASLLAGYELLLLAIMAFIAFWAGASIGVNIRMPAVLCYTTAVFAAALILPVPSDQALAAGIATLIAGGVQTTLTGLTAPVIGDMPERRAVATTLRKLSTEFLAVSRDKEGTAKAISAVATSMTQAEAFLRESDISGDARRRFVDILATADILAREGRSQYSRGVANVGRPNDPASLEHFELVGLALNEAASALETFHPESNLAELDIIIGELESLNKATNSVTASNVASGAEHLVSSVKAVMEDPNIHRAHRERSLSVWNRIRASISFGSVPLKHGLRMASAAVVGMVVANLMGLNHGSWVAVTMIMLLRPDTGPALTRFVSRGIGNVLGALIVVGVAFLAGGSNIELIVAIGLSSTLLYIVMPVNYTWAAMCSSATAIIALTIGGEHTTVLAVERLTDVLIGCVLGVIWAFLFPIWLRTNLPEQCAEYLTRASIWIKTCSKLALLEPADRVELLEMARHQASRVRGARQSLSATFDTGLVEPPTKDVDIHAIGAIMRHMRECNHSIVAAEHLLAHGTPSNRPASKAAKRTSKDVRRTAALVKQPNRRDNLTKTFDELDVDLTETGSLDIIAIQDLEADQQRRKAEHKALKAKRKKAKLAAKPGGTKKLKAKKKRAKAKRAAKHSDLAVVVRKASKSAHRAYLAAESSSVNHDTFL